jgi:hypothetical protein
MPLLTTPQRPGGGSRPLNLAGSDRQFAWVALGRPLALVLFFFCGWHVQPIIVRQKPCDRLEGQETAEKNEGDQHFHGPRILILKKPASVQLVTVVPNCKTRVRILGGGGGTSTITWLERALSTLLV